MNTTIAAISTAVSASGIGIIRISGPEAMDVISAFTVPRAGKRRSKKYPPIPFTMAIFMMGKKR